MVDMNEHETAVTFDFEGVGYVVVERDGVHSVRLTREGWDLGGFTVDGHGQATVRGWFQGRIDPDKLIRLANSFAARTV